MQYLKTKEWGTHSFYYKYYITLSIITLYYKKIKYFLKIRARTGENNKTASIQRKKKKERTILGARRGLESIKCIY